jgi:hypothetical protein
MSYSGRPYFNIPRPLRLKGFADSETLAGGKSLVARDSMIQMLDPDGSSRDIILPADQDGLIYFIKNTASSGTADIIVKDQSSPAITISTCANGETVLVVCGAGGWFEVFKA